MPGSAKRLMFLLLQRSGLAPAYAALVRPSGAMVLMYHSVVTPQEAPWIDPANSVPVEAFARQMRFLARRRRVIPLGALVDALEQGTPIAPRTVVITFDDGYLDNLRHAKPILDRYSLPATLFVPTGLIDRAEAQWVDRLYTMFQSRTRHTLSLSGAGALDLTGADGARAARRSVAERLLPATRPEREALLAEVREQLRPAAEGPRLTMGWDDVRAWSARPGLDVGVHTIEHLDLSACSEQTSEAQIRGSAARVAQELGRAPEHFSFPYARSTERTRAMVHEAGLRSAVCDAPDPRVRAGCPPERIPRVAAPAQEGLLRFYSSGAYPDLPRLLTRRA